MSNALTITFENNQFVAVGGSGRDAIYKIVTGWPGWRRMPLARREGSVYFGSPWVSSILPVANSPSLKVTWTEQGAAKRDQLLEDLSLAHAALGSSKLSHPKAKSTYKPKPHQVQAINAASLMGYRCLLADDMGLGKTATTLWCVQATQAQHLLVICPVSVKFNWARELGATLDGNDWLIEVIDGTRKQRADQLAHLKSRLAKGYSNVMGGTVTINMARYKRTACIINYDLLHHLTDDQQGQLSRFVSGQFLVTDESHYLKNRNSLRATLVRQLFGGARWRMLLTGTPVWNEVSDLYNQVELMRPDVWTSERDFLKRHCTVRVVRFGKNPEARVTGAKNIKALNAVMNTVQIRRTKAEVLDLPPMTTTYPEISLDKDSSSIYHAMKEFGRMELSRLDPDANVFDPRLRGGATQVMMRCEQIAQGFLGGIPEPLMEQLSAKVLRKAEKIKGRPRELMFPTSAKVTHLIETTQAMIKQGGKPVVFSRFNAPMQWFHDFLHEMDINAGFLHGSLSAKDKDALIIRFQESELDAFLVQIKMAQGFNLTNSQDCIIFGRDWAPAVNVQAPARLHRMGQKGTVNLQIPIVRKTIETTIHKKLGRKDADADCALSTMTVQELMEAL